MTPTISDAPVQPAAIKSRIATFTRATRPAAWMVGVQGLELVSQTVAGILIARHLGRAALGEFTYGFSLAAILSVFLLFGSGDVAISLYTDGRHRPSAVLTTSLRIWLRGAVLCSSLAISWVAINQLGSTTAWVVLAAVLALILNGLASVLNQAIVAHGASHLDFVGVALSRGLLLALVIRAALDGELLQALLSYVFGALTLCGARALLVHSFLFPLHLERDTTLEQVMWSRGRHVGVGAIFGSLSARADALMLHAWAGAEQTGLYGASYRIINGLDAAGSAVASGLYPAIARKVAQGDRASARRESLLAAGLLSAGILTVVPFAGFAIRTVYGSRFESAGPMFAVLLIAAALQVGVVFFHKWCIAAGRERVLPRGQLLSAAVNLGSNALLIPRFGAMGAAVATLLAEVSLVLFYATALAIARPTRIPQSANHEI